MPDERLITFRPRTVLGVVGIVLLVAFTLLFVWTARAILSWIFVALFLALALNPAVEFLQARWIPRRGLAVAAAYFGALAMFAALGALFIPTLVAQVNDFVNAIPGYVQDLSEGRGPLGSLERRYDIVERVRGTVEEGGAARVLGLSGAAVSITRSIITAIVAVVTIAFLTFFMLLEGPGWIERAYALLPERSRERWRGVGRDVYRTVGGYVAGNLLISIIAGVASTIVLAVMGVPYAVALGLLVAVLDLVPLAGATIAAIIVSTVAFLDSVTAGIVVLAFFLVYQQVENHFLLPIVYSRTVQLSPLAILIAVLIGAELAGILGALAAIPVAGAIQVVLLDWQKHRRAGGLDRPLSGSAEPG